MDVCVCVFERGQKTNQINEAKGDFHFGFVIFLLSDERKRQTKQKSTIRGSFKQITSLLQQLMGEIQQVLLYAGVNSATFIIFKISKRFFFH